MDEGVCQAALDLVGQGALGLLGMEALKAFRMWEENTEKTEY